MVLNLLGQRVGRLVVIAAEPPEPARQGRYWRCRCDCGRVVPVLAARLKRSHTTSCGCLKLERISTLNKTHGLRKTAEFTVWAMMRQRVLNPNNQAYRYYGARGITICAAWDSFEQFLADMGPRLSSSHSIDRIDTDGPYSPENCRWATREQQRNNRRDSLTLEYGGQTLPLAEWARVTGIKYKTLLWRVQHGRTPTEALAR